MQTKRQFNSHRAGWAMLLCPMVGGSSQNPAAAEGWPGTAQFPKVLADAGCGWMFQSHDGKHIIDVEFPRPGDYSRFTLADNDHQLQQLVHNFTQICEEQMAVGYGASSASDWLTQEITDQITDVNERRDAAFRLLIPAGDLATLAALLQREPVEPEPKGGAMAMQTGAGAEGGGAVGHAYNTAALTAQIQDASDLARFWQGLT
jgi:hypothetical protein